MNYRKHYDLLISKYGSHTKPDDVYTERHHIIPKSRGGSNDEDNLVYLSARAHFVAHWLLWKIYRDQAMALAFKRMCEAPKHSPRVNISGKRYEYAKKAVSEAKKGKMPWDVTGINNPMHREDVAKKISDSQKEQWKNPELAEKRNKHKAKTYLITYPCGKQEQVTGLKRWCKENHINYSSMCYLAKTGKTARRAKGFRCEELTTLREDK